MNNSSLHSNLPTNTKHEIDNLTAELEAGINKAVAESRALRDGTNILITQVNELHARTDELSLGTDELKARTDALQKQIDDLILTHEFSIDLSECFLAYPQFTNPETGKLKKYRVPIRAYCPTIYSSRPKTGGKFLREIHIKISADNLFEYPTRYDLAAANDILRCVIQGYKQEKRMRIIAKDHSDDTEYWYFQFQVSDNQECIDLAKLIVSKWLQIVYKQQVAASPADN
jgi:hypothetical protein